MGNNCGSTHAFRWSVDRTFGEFKLTKVAMRVRTDAVLDRVVVASYLLALIGLVACVPDLRAQTSLAAEMAKRTGRFLRTLTT